MWVTQQTVPTPLELQNAINYVSRRLRIDRYRSRTDVTPEHINRAFCWEKLQPIKDGLLQERSPHYINYRTRVIKRGVSVDEAKSEARTYIENHNNVSHINILTFNTGVSQANSDAVKEMIEADENYTELTDLRAMLVSAPTHKIHIYYFKREYETDPARHNFIILNNLDTPTVVFKIGTAIMLTLNPFEEQTQQFAEAWLTGDGNKICEAVAAYYKEYNDHKAEREREQALETLENNMIASREDEFRRRIEEVQQSIDNCYANIQNYMGTLRDIKGEYLLYKLEDQSSKVEELKTFLRSCGNKISYISCSNNALYMIYNTEMLFFDENLIKPYFNSHRENTITRANSAIQQLMKDIFIDKKYTLQITTGAKFDLYNNRVCWYDPTNIYNTRQLQGIPNPHHRYYDCWGDNEPYIRRALADKDYITAIGTTFAAMSGINLADTAVIDKFVHSELDTFQEVACLKNNETNEIISIQEYKRRYENAHNETNE